MTWCSSLLRSFSIFSLCLFTQWVKSQTLRKSAMLEKRSFVYTKTNKKWPYLTQAKWLDKSIRIPAEIVWHSGHGPEYTGPFGNKALLDSSNTRLVYCSDCDWINNIYFPLFHQSKNEWNNSPFLVTDNWWLMIVCYSSWK